MLTSKKDTSSKADCSRDEDDKVDVRLYEDRQN